MSSEKRGPSASTVKVDPSIEIHQTLYPYFNFKQTGFGAYMDSFKRTISSFNPLALPQVPTSEQEAIGTRNGAGYYWQDMYPNTIHFDQVNPSHYDPFADTRKKWKYGVKHATQSGDRLELVHQYLPRFCQRTIASYKRCLVANEDSAARCAPQQLNILGVCPNFALDGLRQKKLATLKNQALNNQLYCEVMDVPAYNKGRTVANVSRRNWNDGTADKLRTDSMWIDDRYVDITQEEIEQAKARVQKRNDAKGHKLDSSIHFEMYDRTYERPPENTPLYP